MGGVLSQLVPEIVLLIGACICMVMGLAREVEVRKLTVHVAGASLFLAAVMVFFKPGMMLEFASWEMDSYIKLAVCGMGLLLLIFASGIPEKLPTLSQIESGEKPFDPALAIRGEFFAFFLFSLCGVMLCAGAHDLVWLFLALELTSLPTYVMIAISRDRADSAESAVKYFFLGALAAATFLYGFALIYGATGSTEFAAIHAAAMKTGVTPLLMAGIALSIIGVSFKVAAVPMHFYTADVYQGATTPMSAFLAFVPKTAGFVALILLVNLIVGVQPGQVLPQPITWLIWVMAALTMTFGNVLGLLQNNVKRMLAYSSIAHSGYMMVGLLGIGAIGYNAEAIGNGAAGILFYLIAYGLANLAAFAVLACVERDGDEAQSFHDLAGLVRRRPGLATILLLATLSLIGLPPMVGFVGKIYLFGSALSKGFSTLVVIAVVNSAISAVYYLRLANVCFFGEPNEETTVTSSRLLPWTAGVSAVLAFGLFFGGNFLANTAKEAGASVSLSSKTEAVVKSVDLPADQN